MLPLPVDVCVYYAESLPLTALCPRTDAVGRWWMSRCHVYMSPRGGAQASIQTFLQRVDGVLATPAPAAYKCRGAIWFPDTAPC